MLDFNEVKRIPIEQVVRRYGVELHQTDKGASARCPLPTHKQNDKGKTFSVHVQGNYWRCYSDSCNQGNGGKRGGDVINFVALMENYSQKQAAEKLNEWYGVKEQKEPPQSEAARQSSDESPNSSLNGNSAGGSVKYMQTIGAWFEETFPRKADEDDQTYRKRLLNSVKTQLITSYKNGRASIANPTPCPVCAKPREVRLSCPQHE
jgi:hypothetical protein